MKTTVVFLMIFLFAACAAAADIYVISNQGLSITPDEVKDVFLGEKQFSGSARLVPVDNASVQEAALPKILKMDAAKYNTYWTKKSFRDGVQPPPVKNSDAEVIAFVKNTPGGVGYVKSSPAGVKVVKKY